MAEYEEENMWDGDDHGFHDHDGDGEVKIID